ncbi:hypothetical protein BDV09DRAFT_200891 [Aspergillus tetrazonus]
MPYHSLPYHSLPYHSLPWTSLSPPDKLEIYPEGPTANANKEGGIHADLPYSQLIYKALSAAPGNKLPLQGIYSWFEKNTAKGKDRSSNGWQNSIRYNLSMNAAFEVFQEKPTPNTKVVKYWRLTDEAMSNGIQSTTRYREKAKCKKPATSEPPKLQRQISGAKGGIARKRRLSSFRARGQQQRLD